MSNLLVTIMAAGEGKRMNSNIPKVLHKFKSIPMLIRIIIESNKLLPDKIIVITGKYDNLIKNTVNEYFREDNLDILNNIIFVKQEIPNGTGGAIKTSLQYYNENNNVLILNGDMPLISFKILITFINNLNKNLYLQDINLLCKLLVAKLDNPFGYGRIVYDNCGDFFQIKEEKECTEVEKKNNIINVGIYYFSSKLLQNYIPLINNNNSQNEYYLTDIFEVIRRFSDTKIVTSLIEDSLIYRIMGVNTSEELKKLEEIYEQIL